MPPSIESGAPIDDGSDLADDRSAYSKALEPRQHSGDGGAPFYLGKSEFHAHHMAIRIHEMYQIYRLSLIFLATA